MRLRLIYAVFCLAALGIASYFFSSSGTYLASAQSSIGRPIGGRILTVSPCDTGLWITVGPPLPGSFMIMPTTRIFKFGSFRPGAFVLGLSVLGAEAPCIVGVVPVGVGEVMSVVGTSS